MASWGALKRAWPARQGRWSSPSALPSWGLTWSIVSNSGLPCTKKAGISWRGSSTGPQRWCRAWSISCMKKGWALQGGWIRWSLETPSSSYSPVTLKSIRVFPPYVSSPVKDVSLIWHSYNKKRTSVRFSNRKPLNTIYGNDTKRLL